MMNAFRFCVSSLNADVRSTRTHSSCLSTKLLSPDFPCLLAVHYIACLIHGQTHMNEKLQKTQISTTGGQKLLEWWAQQDPPRKEVMPRQRSLLKLSLCSPRRL